MYNRNTKKKTTVARLSVISNSCLIVLKLIVGVLSGSVSIISEAIHSAMDLVAAIIAFFSVRISNQPPDKKHPYGHGKFENISGVIEAVLIFVAAGIIIFEAIKKLYNQSEIEEISIGIVVMFISSAVNILVSRKLYKTAKETDSLALEADALHLKTDVYTSIGVAFGLLLIWITDIHILDPIVAIIVALFIIYESYNLLKKAYSPLLDTTLPHEEVEQIKLIINSKINESMSYHDLRTRKSGNYKYVDLHLEVKPNITVVESHEICDEIEKALKEGVKDIDINIHIEPLN